MIRNIRNRLHTTPKYCIYLIISNFVGCNRSSDTTPTLHPTTPSSRFSAHRKSEVWCSVGVVSVSTLHHRNCLLYNCLSIVWCSVKQKSESIILRKGYGNVSQMLSPYSFFCLARAIYCPAQGNYLPFGGKISNKPSRILNKPRQITLFLQIPTEFNGNLHKAIRYCISIHKQ